MNKSSLRETYSKLRLALPRPEFDGRCKKLCINLIARLDFVSIATVHVFLPILSKKEPNTWLIIDALKKEHPHVRISVPKTKGHELVNYYFEGTHQIAENKWGIPEPQFGEITPAEKIDVVLVPLLAFDKQGNRVGYGKGFYDRFLAQCRPDCKKVGLSFFEPVNLIEDCDERDVRLTECITPSRLFLFTT